MATRVVPTGCALDCGGRCPLLAHVADGKVVKVTLNQRAARPLGINACIRGLMFHKAAHHPDRLRHPMRRIGPRGSASFRRISWEEAMETVAGELERAKEEHGAEAILDLSGSGSVGATLHSVTALTKRFLRMHGGHIELVPGYSAGAARAASNYTYGTIYTDHDREDLLNSRLIILWGWDPLDTIFGSMTATYLHGARRKGIRMVCIDPRRTTSASLAHQWIPIRPGTDTAMANAMAYVIFKEGLEEKGFIEEFTLGFEDYWSYLSGREDGIVKTPLWASRITMVPATVIEDLALDYARSKPAALMPGWGPQRTAYGEQFHRAVSALAAMTGNIGAPGGNPAGINTGRGMPDPTPSLSLPSNPVDMRLPKYLWTDLVLKGRDGGYPADVKMGYCAAYNPVAQHPDTNKTVRALRKLEFLVVQDYFMTPTARYADILLPACTWLERNDILTPWAGHGRFILFQNKAIEPIHEAKTDMEIFTMLARRLGFADQFNPWTEDEWLRDLASSFKVPDYEAFRGEGVFILPGGQGPCAFHDQVSGGDPFPTPSGRIEIFSSRLADMKNPLIPPLPKYLEAWEGISDPGGKYPLQLVTPKAKGRVHSSLHNLHLLRGPEDHSLWVNPADAGARGISRGERVRVFNDRGSVMVTAYVTDRVMPGVLSLPAGMWYSSVGAGVDNGGCANVLTSDIPTPLAGASTQNTCLVQIETLA